MLTQDNLANANPLGKSGRRATVAASWPSRVRWLIDKYVPGEERGAAKRLADHLGLTAEAVRIWLNGGTVSLENLGLILRRCPEVSAHYLITGEPPEEADPEEVEKRGAFAAGLDRGTRAGMLALMRERGDAGMDPVPPDIIGPLSED